MSDDTISIYNATDGPLPIDRAGRMLAARSSDDVSTIEGLSSHIDAERIIVISDLPQPEDDGVVASGADVIGEDNMPAEAPQTTTSKRARKSAASPQEA